MSNTENHAKHETIKRKDLRPTFGKYGWLLIVGGILCMFMAGTGKNDSLNVIMIEFEKEFGLNVGTMSGIGMLMGYCAVVIMIFIGAIAQKVGIKRVVITCGIFMLIGIGLYNFVTDIKGFAVAYFFIVVGEVGLGPYGIPMMIQNWFPTRKGQAMGWVTIGNNLGSIFIAWLLTGSWTIIGLRGGFIPWMVIGAVGLMIIAFFIKEYPEQQGCMPDNDKDMTREEADKMLEEGLRYMETSPFSFKKLLKTPQMWKIGIALGLLDMGCIGIIDFIVPCFINKGFSQTTAMMVMSVVAVLAIPCSIGLGMLDTRFGTKKATLLVLFSSVIALVCMALPVRGLAWIGAWGGAAIMGCTNNLVCSLTSSVFGRYDFKKAYTCLYPIYAFLQTSGLGLVGMLYAKTNAFTIPYLVCAAASCVSIIIILTLKDECIGRTDEHMDLHAAVSED